MSGKVKNKGSSNYDTHNNVMALEGDIDDHMKYKISKVMEVVKNRSQDDVMLVLQFFDYDIDTTVDAFLEDGAAEILKKWSHTNSIKPASKNKKKKKNKKKTSVQENSSATPSEMVSNGEPAGAVNAEVESSVDILLPNGDSPSPVEGSSSHEMLNENKNSTEAEDTKNRDSPSHTQTDEVKVEPSPAEQRLQDQDAATSLSVSRLAGHSQAETTTVAAVITVTSVTKTSPSGSGNERSSVSPSDYSRSTNRNRHRSSSGSQLRTFQEPSRVEPAVSHASVPAGSAPSAFSQAPGKKILEKSLKDLSRQTVALQRVSHLLEEELDNSFKRIKTAISEAQRLLEDRNQDLESEMERVKRESRQLLNQRKELAAELKQRAERASSMAESELNELRADIKHFVVERKYDEELGKTCRFMWDKDRITDEIKSFGEVYHVKNCYSQRRQSVSSVASSSNMTSSITEPPELSPTSQPELDHESSEPNHETTLPDTRPQGNPFANRARVFFRRSYTNSHPNNQPFKRGTYPQRGRGGMDNRGGRGLGRGGRRNDGFRGGYNKPHYTPQRVDDHGSSGGSAMESSNSATSWLPRDQRPARQQHNPRFQGRVQTNHSPRRNFESNERVPATSDTHVNGSDETSDLLNGFVDH